VAVEAGLDSTTRLHRLVESAAALVDARHGALGLLDPAGALTQFATVGIDAEGGPSTGRRPAGAGLLGLLVLEPGPLRLTDLSRHRLGARLPPGHPAVTSFLGVPVMGREHVFGSLYLTDKTGARQFSEEDEQVVMSLATAAGIAFENERLSRRVAELRVAEERERIARQLHDEVIQRLFASALSLQSAARLALGDEAARRLEAVVGDLDETITRIRTTIFDLRDDGRG